MRATELAVHQAELKPNNEAAETRNGCILPAIWMTLCRYDPERYAWNVWNARRASKHSLTGHP